MPRGGDSKIRYHLTDKDGNILNPYASNAIIYREILSGDSRKEIHAKLECGKSIILNQVIVSIKGYMVIYLDDSPISEPIPFRKAKCFYIFAPKGTKLCFKTWRVCFDSESIWHKKKSTNQIQVSLKIETIVNAEANVDLIVPVINSDLNPDTTINEVNNTACINVIKVFDSCIFESEIKVFHKSILVVAEVYQYNTLSDGIRKVYFDTDEIEIYGNRGILDPQSVSFYDVFINGVLQPRTNYKVEKGLFLLETEDAPLKGAPIIISFITLKNEQEEILQTEIYQYNTIYIKGKKEFANDDELIEYGNNGILNPRDVSYYNLFINGVLQPKSTYIVHEGVLTLISNTTYPNECPIILQFLKIRDSDDRLLKVETYQYNTLANKSRVYTNADELSIYGNKGILDPNKVCYQVLFVNGVIQPQTNYIVEDGVLELRTEDMPLNDSPLYIQYLKRFY